MGIFSRTRDIIAAHMTDLLDKSEDPAKMIRMIIMEMEETLVEVRASAARTIADQKEMKRAMIKAQQAVQDWQDKAELALSKGREDLAKAALVEKNKAKGFIDTTQVEIDLLGETLALNEADIAKLESKLREARNRQNALINRIESATQRSKLREMIRGPRVEEAFSRFEVLERRADMAEGRADALGLADGTGTRNLADEFGPQGVRVNCIAPGLIKTDFAKALWENPDTLARSTARSPLRRIGEPEEIAGAAVFLASRAGAFTTGQTFVIDGGQTISGG